MSDRALVDTDFGTLLTAHCLSVISGLGVLRKVPISKEGLQELSGLSTASSLDGTWSRCSEKLPTQRKSSTYYYTKL